MYTDFLAILFLSFIRGHTHTHTHTDTYMQLETCLVLNFKDCHSARAPPVNKDNTIKTFNCEHLS